MCVGGGVNLGGLPSGTGGLQLGGLGARGLPPGGLQLGQMQNPGGLQLGQPGVPKLGEPPPAYNATPGLQLTNQTRATTTGLQLGTTLTAGGGGGLQLGTMQATGLAKLGGGGGLQLGGLTAKATPQLGLQQKTTGGLQLGGMGTTMLGQTKPGAPSLGKVLYCLYVLVVHNSCLSGLTGLKTAAGAGAATTTRALPTHTGPLKKYTYRQLEEQVNKVSVWRM